jgi:hypothetical protein
MQTYLQKNSETVAKKYTWDMPSPKLIAQSPPPKPSPALSYQSHLFNLLGGRKVDRDLVDGVLFSAANLSKWGDSFAQNTKDLLKSRGIYNSLWKTQHVDVVQDVINLVPVRFLANEIVSRP